MNAGAASKPWPPYRIHTPRLLLRCFAPEDTELRREAVESSGAHLAAFFPPSMTLEAHAAHIRKLRSGFDNDTDRGYAVFQRDGGRFLGETGLLSRAGIGAFELAYWLRSDTVGKGIATEMAAAMVKIAFEIDGVKRVDVVCSPENAASAAVAKRLGFTLEGRLRDRQLSSHHRREDLLSFSMLPSEFPGSVAFALEMEAFDFLGRPIRAA